MTQIALILNDQHNAEIRKAAAKARRSSGGTRQPARDGLLTRFSRWAQYSVSAPRPERNPDHGSGGLNRGLHRASG